MYRRVGGFRPSKQAPSLDSSEAQARGHNIKEAEMRAAKLLAVLAMAALGIGSVSAVALAAVKKKTAIKTSVVFHRGSPTVDKSGLVVAMGTLHTTDTALPDV